MRALLLIVLLASSPGDATRLVPDPAGAPPPPAPEAPAPVPSSPLVPLGSMVAAAAVLAAGTRPSRLREPSPADGLGLSGAPLVVFVPGHGSSPDDFEELAGLMGLGPRDYRVFDYRWIVETDSHVEASQAAGIDDVADALHAYVAGLADGRDVYLVGFSKGGAGIAELVARWDDGMPAPVTGVVGAALLDPPISGGAQGILQSLGRFVGPIPDDGGYDPVRCSWSEWCRDRREHLGEASGVEVLVIRNPKAGITNFDDRPEGLRVYDVADVGRGPLASLLHNPFSYPRRVSEAHNALLSDRRVAGCLRAEMADPGSCNLDAPRSKLRGPRLGEKPSWRGSWWPVG